MAPSPTSSEDSGSPEPSVIVSVSGAGESDPAGSQVDGSGRSNVSWKNPLVEGIMEVPRVTRHIDLQEVFDNVLLQRQWTDTEEMEMQQQGKQPTMWPEKVYKKSFWSKFKGSMEKMFSERIENQMHGSGQDSTVMAPHVNHQAFKMLIKKIMRWKKHSRWKRVPTTNSYRKQKLLKFFSDYVRTNDIFTFLRLVAAIWICSHSEEFEPLVLPELNEDYNLRDWCSREVLQCQVFTDHVQMTALVTALGVPLRVEYLLQGVGQDFYTDQEDSQDDTPRSTCWPHRQYQTPHGHVVPYVTVLYTNAHYDILYPHCRDVRSIDGRCNQLTAQVQRPTAASLSQQIARGESWSGADSSHRIIQESSTGVRIQINMKCTRKLPLTGAHEYDEHRSILSEATDN
nr:unnamed protein product [Digitaria exilis]